MYSCESRLRFLNMRERESLSNGVKEELAFGSMMTIGMVAIMLGYNAILTFGFTAPAAAFFATQVIPVFIIAFAIEQFFINHNVHQLHQLIVSPHDPKIKHIIVMAVLMVTCMCLSMSLYATLVGVGTENNFWQHYLAAVARNYPVALLAQLAVVGPLVRMLHTRLFQPAPALAASPLMNEA
jgi:hypothetical protein